MDKPSYTIPARYHKDGYDALVKYSDTKIRKLTVTELKRIQTFGDDFQKLLCVADSVFSGICQFYVCRRAV
jgi:hypothetical protein